MKECEQVIFYGVGLGPGDPELLTLKAVRVLREVDVVFHATGARSESSISGGILDSVADCRAERVELVFSMAADPAARAADWKRNADRVARELRAGRNCAFVTIGDPAIYSTFTYLVRELRKRLPRAAVVTVPGITAFQAAAARANLPLAEDDEPLTVIPAWKEDAAVRNPADSVGTRVFLKTYRHRDRLVAAIAAGPAPAEILYAARVGLAGERIVTGPAALKRQPEEYLSLMIVKRPASRRGKKR